MGSSSSRCGCPCMPGPHSKQGLGQLCGQGWLLPAGPLQGPVLKAGLL